MANRGRRSPARLLAPLALVAVAIAVLVVIQSSTSSGGDSRGGDTANTTSTSEQTTTTRSRRVRPSYTVKLNDTLEAISQKTGVSVERIQELNPDLDPQNLIVGQKIKLRE
jgi:LysM repeat protein